MDKSNQYDYIKAYNAENYKTFSIKISPEEWTEIDEISKKMNISKARLTVNAVRLYAQSLTAADTAKPETPSPAPEEISPETITGAEKTQARTPTETETETPEEDQQGKPQDSPQDAHSKPQDASKQGKTNITSKAGNAPQRAAQNVTERATEDQPGQVRIYTETDLRQAIEEAAQQAAQKAARQARQEIKREMRVQAIQAAGMTIGAARRAKASTVNAVNGLKPIRIRRPKK